MTTSLPGGDFNQFVCAHGHRYYDGDQGVGSPYDDGSHDAFFQHVTPQQLDLVGPENPIDSWEPWERDAYRHGYTDGLTARGT